MNQKISEVQKGKGKQRRRSNRKAQLFIAGIAAIALSNRTQAQEAVRTSLAGQEAAEARRAAISSAGYYNLHLGQTAWNFRGNLGIEANDNIKLEPNAPQSDFIFRPELSTRMLWRVTEQNAFNFALSAGYSAYVQHSELDRWFITPGSELSFDVYVGDFLINFHDRLSMTENSYQDPTVVGVGNYSQLQIDAGITSTWDLNKVVLKLGYDHVNYTLVSGDSGLPNGRSEVFFLSGGYTFRPGLVAGLELGGGFLHYSGGTTSFQNAADANAGAFVDVQLTENAHLRANGGYTVYSPDAAAGQPAAADFTGVYGRLLLVHKVNRFLGYTLGGSRTVNFAFFGGTIDLATAQLQLDWSFIQGVSVGTFFQYDHGAQLFSGTETFDRR